MNIVIPMAGRGSRFVEAGYTVPKPLIEVRGRPMYTWAVDGLPLRLAESIIFLCLAEHLRDGFLERDIHHRYVEHNVQVIPVDKVTEGQACTVLLARSEIDNVRPLLIYNADTYCPTSLAGVLESLGPTVAGVIDVFRAEGDQWSFARFDDECRVLETAEKRRISDWATTGLYYFRHGSDYVRYADAAMKENDRVNGEFYVAPLYNRFINDGADIRANKVEEIWALGTPGDLERFDNAY